MNILCRFRQKPWSFYSSMFTVHHWAFQFRHWVLKCFDNGEIVSFRWVVLWWIIGSCTILHTISHLSVCSVLQISVAFYNSSHFWTYLQPFGIIFTEVGFEFYLRFTVVHVELSHHSTTVHNSVTGVWLSAHCGMLDSCSTYLAE